MKKNLIITFVLFVLIGLRSASAQTPITHKGDVFVTTQAQVNALRTSLTAGATRIVGNVTIGPKSGASDITDLSPFAAITEITGYVLVQRNPDLPNLMGLNQLQSIGGSFEVKGNAALTSLGDFSTLQSIGGRFGVKSNSALTSLGNFSTLQSIGGNFYVSFNNELTSLGDFSTLQTIGGRFGVKSNSALTSLGDFPALQTIGGDFVVGGYDAGNASLTSLGDFPALQTIGGDFVVGGYGYGGGNVALTSLGDFTTLQSIGGRFGVINNDALTSLGDFPALQSIGDNFFVSSNYALTSLGDFSALQSIGGNFEVKSNYDLTSLGDFPTLQSIGGGFVVEDNNDLTSMGAFPMLASIGSSDDVYVPSTDSYQDDVSIMVERNKRLQDCCVLTTFLSGASNAVSGKVFINNNAIGCSSTTEVNCDPFLQVDQKVVFVAKTATESTLNLFSTLRWQLSKPNTGADWITNIAASGGNSDASSIIGENDASITITTTANPSNTGRSTTLMLRAVDQAGNVLTDPAPVTISFTQLGTTHTGDVSVTTQAEVDALRTSLTAGASRIVGNVTIGSASGTSDISDLSPLVAITQITGYVRVRRNPDLPNLMGLNQLQTIGDYFEVFSNDHLTSLGSFPFLQSIGGIFEVRGNRSLTSLGDFTALQSIGGSFVVEVNRSLTSLGDFPALQTIGSNFDVSGNDVLTSLGDFPSLQSIGSNFDVYDNETLTSLGDFPSLQSIGSNFDVSGNAALTSLEDFPVLQSIDGRFEVRDNATLTSLGGFPMLASIGSSDGIYVPSTRTDEDNVSIMVRENDQLQDCCVLTTFLSGATNAVSGKVFINNNALRCNSTTEINCDPFLQVSQKVIFAAKTVAEGTLDLFSTLRWQLSKPNTGAEWITNIAADGGNSDASSITGENNAFITITTTANSNDAGRSTTLTLRAIDMAGNALTDRDSVTILFTQLGITHTGDVSVTTQAEVDALRNLLTAGTTHIAGNVTIGSEFETSDISDLSPLTTITEITGYVVVQRSPYLPNLIGLNQLQSIGGSFVVERNRSLTSLGDFSALQTIGGSFEVDRNRTLTSLGNFSALQSIGGGFLVSSTALTSLGDFPALQTIGGRFEVDFNHSLPSLGDFPSLQSIGGDFEVYYNASLTSLGGFPMLVSIGEQYGVSIKVAWNKRLQDCCVLTAFLRDATNAVSGQVFINDNAPGCNSTTQVNCNSFLQVGQKVVFASKTATESMLEIFSRLRWQLSKPNTGAEWITNIAVDGGNSDASSITGENDTFIAITTTTNPNDAGRSTTLTLTAMDMAGNALTDPTPITIFFTQLGTTHTGDVSVTTQAEVDALRNLLTAGTTHIAGNVTIGPKSGTSDISDLSPLTTITEITGDVLVRRNPDLSNLMGLNQLQSIGGDFVVSANIALTSLGDFPALQSIGGDFEVGGEDDDGNAALTSLGDFSTLQSIGGGFEVENNGGLTSLRDFPALQSIGGSFYVGDNASLTSLEDFPALQTIGVSFEVGENAALTSLRDFPILQTIGGSFEVNRNATLTSLGGFPMLASIGDQHGVSIVIKRNDQLQDCCVLTEFLSGAISAVSGKVIIKKNATGCSSKAKIKSCAEGGSTTKGQ